MLEKLKDKVDAAVALMEEVPLGNSAFQNVYLGYDSDPALFPERALRHVLLQLHGKLAALRSYEFSHRRTGVDLREAKAQLAASTEFQRERLLITIEEKEAALKSDAKMVRDCAVEVQTYLAMLDKLPKDITRERFEAAEARYWVERFKNQALLEFQSTGGISAGLLEALSKVGVEVRPRRLEDGGVALDLIENKSGG